MTVKLLNSDLSNDSDFTTIKIEVQNEQTNTNIFFNIFFSIVFSIVAVSLLFLIFLLASFLIPFF